MAVRGRANWPQRCLRRPNGAPCGATAPSSRWLPARGLRPSRRHPRAAPAAFGERSAATYPAAPGRLPDARRRGLRAICGWRSDHQCAGRDCRRPGRWRVPRSGLIWCARRSAPVKLGDGAQHLQREHALCGRGVDWVSQAPEMRPRCLQLFDDRQQVAFRAFGGMVRVLAS